MLLVHFYWDETVPKLEVARDVDCIAYHSWEVLRPATTMQYYCGDWGLNKARNRELQGKTLHKS